MAKDPAMLWYWSDWHSGTGLLSRFLKGCYMDLLNAQFNFGALSLEEIKTCLGSDFGTSWPTLQKKFKQTENGLFFNERLQAEKEKRAAFCESRRGNKLGNKDKEPTYDATYGKHMNQHMENENRSENKNLLTDVLWTTEVQNFKNDFRWREKFCRDKRIRLPDLELKVDEFIADLELKEDYKDLKELKRHFTNWFNKNKNASNNRNFTAAGNANSQAARTFLDGAKADYLAATGGK